MVIVVCRKKYKKESDVNVLKLGNAIIAIGIFLFLIHIYCYAFPTFLFLLVYPTKMITVVAYLITFVFVTSMVSSISIRLIIVVCIKNHRTSTVDRWRSMMITTAFFVLVYPFFMFVIVIQILYVLIMMLGEASVISAVPYTLLLSIPTPAVSAASWLVKNKIFSSVNEEEDKKESNQENEENEESATNNGEVLALVVRNDNEDKKKAATNDSEALTLVVNEETPINGNDEEIKTYGVLLVTMTEFVWSILTLTVTIFSTYVTEPNSKQ
jgi:hypothetical protein